MTVLVTGGAGYIGSHVIRLLHESQVTVVVADDLSTGCRERLKGATLIEVDLADPCAVDPLSRSMTDHGVQSVIHLAGLKRANESIHKPALYFQQNVGQVANVLLAMERAAVRKIVFSSSAAVYGDADNRPIEETDPTCPTTPYGAAKLAGEELLSWAAADDRVDAVALRYFNVAGAGCPDLGDTARTNLVSIVLERLRTGRAPVIFGDDYPTPDGTCIRDYVHVSDLATAHVAALGLVEEQCGLGVYNVGTGCGTSVREVVDTLARLAGGEVTPAIAPRRAGDPATVVASPERFAARTGWRAARTVTSILASAHEAGLHAQ